MKELFNENGWIRTLVILAFFTGITWVTVQKTSEKIDPLEEKLSEHSERIAVVNTQYNEINKRLERIERKLDWMK